jgi:hypothetical protein
MSTSRRLIYLTKTQLGSPHGITSGFLRAGSESYKKEGAKLLNRFLGRHQQGQQAE